MGSVMKKSTLLSILVDIYKETQRIENNMGWYIFIITDKKINPGDINDIVNNDFDEGSAQRFRKSSSRKQEWGWHTNIDIGNPKMNMLPIRGAFFSYDEAVPAFEKLANGLKRKGYNIIGVSADEGLEHNPIIKSYPQATHNRDGDLTQILPDDEDEKIDKIIKAVEYKISHGEEISADQILDLHKVAKQMKSQKLLDFVKQLSQKLKESVKGKSYMKQALLEYLIRQCVREVVQQVNERDTYDGKVAISYGGVKFDANIRVGNGEFEIVSVSANGKNLTDNESARRLITMFIQFQGGVGRDNHEEHANQQAYSSLLGSFGKRQEQIESSTLSEEDDKKEELPDKKENPDDTTQGAASPPAAGQGTGDEPAIPGEKKPEDQPMAAPGQEGPPASPEIKGIVLVNPRDKSKLDKIEVNPNGDAAIERSLHRKAASLAGAKVKVALSAMRMVKDGLKNPNTTTYLYLGKYDPESDEVFLMADKSLQVAKDASVAPTELGAGTLSPPDQEDRFNPMTAGANAFATRLSTAGATPRRGLEEEFKTLIKKMVNEILESKR